MHVAQEYLLTALDSLLNSLTKLTTRQAFLKRWKPCVWLPRLSCRWSSWSTLDGTQSHIHGCQQVNSWITWTQIALTWSHTDHSQQVTRFPQVSQIKSLLVYESLTLNCHCPFISDIALTPTAATADHSLMLAACQHFHYPFVIILWHLIFIFVSLHFLFIPPLSHWVFTHIIQTNIYSVYSISTIHIKQFLTLHA